MKYKNNLQQKPMLPQDVLEGLIEKYFDCMATEDEELQLRNELRCTLCHSSVIDECKAAMGFFAHEAALYRNSENRRRRSNAHRAVSIAATIVLVASVAIGLYSRNDVSNRCVAYVNGVRIDDEERVMSMMHRDMNSVGRVSESVDNSMMSQLSSMGDALNGR